MIVFAREPIFAPSGHVFAYQIDIGEDYQDTFIKAHDDNTSTLGQAHFQWRDLLDGFVSILHLSNDILMRQLPDDIVPEDTLFEVDNVDHPAGVLDRLVELKAKGFRFVASEQVELNKDILALVDFAKLKSGGRDEFQISQRKALLDEYNVKSIAVDINNKTHYDHAVQKEYSYYQGFFFLDNINKTTDQLPSSKLAVLRLLSEINSDEIDVRKLEKVFEQDATLSYLLFRYINNPLVNKYQEIVSIRHALSYLGEVMIKKFIAIVSLTQMNAGNTPELLQVSMVRAKFCELLAKQTQPKGDATIAFLAGLFSLIDVILAREMAFLMTKVALPAEIKQTLLNRQGSLYLMIQASRGIESAHWDSVLCATTELKMSNAKLNELYVEAIKWANDAGIPDSPDYPVKRP